ncbi:hypothetical protein [Arthrospira platensis]|uniref:hypothetical protein n=1 Tax=Limnospira TaxID=2596745 RepID=UPI0001C391E8|nr:hypothetical protein [Arthrospira platensis]AMW29916.1 hypothetical protein AP285_20250 [Arthrospira platensis YZ]KDR54307.1 hypothetical protein APPUASWS_030030 [Arthrospira platensis str. Paraca]MBD2669733.1 hypothetical protein [Arthrospira platensis FACHB-439]MBD2710517.1 hypothetical protein [Arthrospira platensis FACHB-835]MDT9312078.1 hypothetical protein [Limnospira sp. Paracas R14]QQW27869.1 hypothetical protein AP9108_22325 [Arthrospira sp. PCC 9108]
MLPKKVITVLMVFALCWTTVACGSSSQTTTQQTVRSSASAANRLADGKYPVQQAQYDDGTGEYRLMLLNARPPVFQTSELQMARLTDEQIKAGEKSHLLIENNQPVFYLTEDFQIEYVHNVTETRTDPQTGQTQTVVVRRESNFWTPFVASFVGSAIATSLFSPRYYVPPAYQSGSSLVGYGGSGNSYNQAVSQYRTRYNEPPAAVRNRQTFRTTGTARSSSPGSTTGQTNPNVNRSTGSGAGTSNLRQSQQARPQRQRTPSFGSGSRSPSRSGSSGRRRR